MEISFPSTANICCVGRCPKIFPNSSLDKINNQIKSNKTRSTVEAAKITNLTDIKGNESEKATQQTENYEGRFRSNHNRLTSLNSIRSSVGL